jgi:arabinofuranan 3-O-arabinosyltransferase
VSAADVESEAAGANTEARGSVDRLGRLGLAGFALLCYVPLLLTDPGRVDADSKAYFYLSPDRLLAGAASLWDPQIGAGSVAYQIIGFLFPVGPFYWLTGHVAGIPPWISQRIWMGTLLFGAGLGVRYLLRTLGVRGPGIAVGMVAYAFSPYAIQFASLQSVLLAPWAGMPWMTAFAVRGLRRGGWKYPALLAIVVQLTGSVNASTLAFALLAPALWIPYAVVVAREVDWRRAWGFVWRSGVLVGLTSLWWATALLIESAFGRNALRFTEQLSTTSATLYPLEILRGLGYWIFYYYDSHGPIVGASDSFLQNPAVLFASIVVPALGLLAGALLRWSARAYFVLLVLVGVALAVGSSPFDDRSPLAAAFHMFASGSTAGLALRNSARAVPLVALGLACMLAAGVSALYERLSGVGKVRVGGAIVAGVLVLCLVNAPGVWARNYYDSSLEYDSVPGYWKDAARALDAASHDTRVLALPGSPFGAYTWGATQDPVEPGLMDRPFVTLQQIPEGSDATANLLASLNVPLQAGVLDPNAIAPVARLLGAGDVLVNLDLQTNRYGLVPAGQLWNLLTARPPEGLAAPDAYGTEPAGPRVPELGNLARPEGEPPPPVAVFRVDDPVGIVRTKPADGALIVDGDGSGLVAMAGAGLLDANRLVVYSPTFEREPDRLRDLADGAELVVTDSNRKRPFWATSLTNSFGATEQVDEEPLDQSSYDQRLEVFPDETPRSQTVTILRGVKSVRATQGYGVFNATFSRPALVLDDNVFTGWTVDAGAPVGRGERLRIEFEEPVTTDRVNVVQPLQDAAQGRWISRVSLRFDGDDTVRRDLGDASRTALGQTLSFPERTFSTLEIGIDQTTRIKDGPQNAVGFQEIRVAGDESYARPVGMEETTRMPLDLLETLGPASLDNPLTLLISRDLMDDISMTREVSLPTARTFRLSGTARLGTLAGDAQLDRLLGIPGANDGGVTLNASGRYNDPRARASSAIDGDPATAWTTPLGLATGSIDLTLPADITLDRLDLRLVDDGRHSIPTALQITADDGTTRTVDLGSAPHDAADDGTVLVPVTFEPLAGRRFTFTILDYEPSLTKVYDREHGTLLPSGIAELGVPGVERPPLSERITSRCITDLITVDGEPVGVRLTGSTADALDAQPLQVTPCNGRTVRLSAGRHVIVAAQTPNSPSGVDLSHLVLRSAAGGAAAPPTRPEPSAAAPEIRIVDQSRTSVTLEAAPASEPYWVVLGQSINRGWSAEANGRDLGEPTLVDGYANGWRVERTSSGEPTTIKLTWTPQRGVSLALLASLLAMLVCIGIVVVAVRADRRRARAESGDAPQLDDVTPAPLPQRRRALIGTVVAVTLVTALLVQPWVAPLVGGFVLLAILRTSWRRALRLAPVVIVGGTAVYVTVAQVVRDYRPEFQWAKNFSAWSIPVWAAIVLLAADALIAAVWRTDFDDA